MFVGPKLTKSHHWNSPFWQVLISLLIFLTLLSKIYLNSKPQLWQLLFNKLVILPPQTKSTWKKLRMSAFQQYQGPEVSNRVFITKYVLVQNGWGCAFSRFWGAHQNYRGPKNKGSANNSYIVAMMNHTTQHPKNTPNMAPIMWLIFVCGNARGGAPHGGCGKMAAAMVELCFSYLGCA